MAAAADKRKELLNPVRPAIGALGCACTTGGAPGFISAVVTPATVLNTANLAWSPIDFSKALESSRMSTLARPFGKPESKLPLKERFKTTQPYE